MIDRRSFMRSLALIGAGFLVTVARPVRAQATNDDEAWELSNDFEKLKPMTIAVLPMDNLSLEPGVEEALEKAVYERLASKGYAKISADHVAAKMKQLGISIPALLQGISPKRLGEELQAEALLMGQIEQSARINKLAYDAVVVSCSLRLVHAETGKVLWHAEQWRSAHRQWQIDPVNAFINGVLHTNASREDRVAYLVQEMLKTLPQGPVASSGDDLLQRAVIVK